jgi:hypothetical protein
MKRLFVCVILVFSAFFLISYSPAPIGNSYGRRIFFRNASSYNLYLEFDFLETPFAELKNGQFCLEKRDATLEGHSFFVPFADENNFDINSTYPNNYFLRIRMYDMDTGTLLKEINPSDKEIFILVEGGAEEWPYWEVYTLIIEDYFLTGEIL